MGPSSEGKVSLVVDGPLMGWRYGLQFVPVADSETENLAEQGKSALTEGAYRLAGGLLARWLGRQGKEDPARVALIDGIRSAFAGVLGEGGDSGLGDQTALVGYLWEDRMRQLVPTFGEFLPPCWGDRFACGRGVVGHAFRFCDPAYWCKDVDEGDRTNKVIYWERPNQWVHGSYDHRWIAAFPLRLFESDLAIGVVAVGMGATATPWERGLSRAIEDVSRGEDSSDLQDLDWRINHAFWRVLQEYRPGLDDSDQRVVKAVVARLLEHALASARKPLA